MLDVEEMLQLFINDEDNENPATPSEYFTI
jgi:hypothetical protein